MSLQEAIAGEVSRQLRTSPEYREICDLRDRLPRQLREEVFRQLKPALRDCVQAELFHLLRLDRDFRYELLKMCAQHTTIEDAVCKMLEQGAWVDRMADMVEKAISERLRLDTAEAKAKAEAREP